MLKNKKSGIFILVGLFLTIGAVAFLLSYTVVREESKLSLETNTSESVPEVQKIAVNDTKSTILEINGVKHESDIENNTTVYELMSKLENEGRINFEEKTYAGMGKFIEEINGISGDGEKYWIYYVNGEKAKIGVSNYKLKEGDIVSFRYQRDI